MFSLQTRVADFFISELLFADDCELVAHSVNNIQFAIDDFPCAYCPFTFLVNLKDNGSTKPTKRVTRAHVLTFLHLATFSQAYTVFFWLDIIQIQTHCETASTLAILTLHLKY